MPALPIAPRERPHLPDMRPSKLCTFGYEGLEIKTFLARLEDAKIRSIVDVRELPLSRKKGFSKTSFSEYLAAAEIAYLHVPALGCPKRIRDEYRRDGDWSAYTRAFLAYLHSQRPTVQDLATLACSTTVCLVCFEADYTMCHRTDVARAAHRAGAPAIQHLTARTVVPDLTTRRVA
jgi:uncharacterized protein (DUF488 family)